MENTATKVFKVDDLRKKILNLASSDRCKSCNTVFQKPNKFNRPGKSFMLNPYVRSSLNPAICNICNRYCYNHICYVGHEY